MTLIPVRPPAKRTATMETPEQRQADDLYRRFVQHDRIFVAQRTTGGLYVVNALSVEELRDVNFRHTNEFWGRSTPITSASPARIGAGPPATSATPS
jgi:hypothetical protein